MNLILGDCLEVLKNIPDGSINLILTSPPYDNLRNYNNSLNWNFDIFKQIANELKRILKDGGVIIWIVNDATINGSETGTSFRQALYFKEIGLNLYDTMIYKKLNYMPLTHRRYEQEFEYMFCLTKGKPNTFNPIMEKCKYAGKKAGANVFKTNADNTTRVDYIVKDERIKGNIFEYATGNNIKGKYKHPAMFPLELAKDQIKTWTNKGDMVLDPFMGSGTTGVACKLLERNFIGIELVEKYYEIANKRINETEKEQEDIRLNIFDYIERSDINE